MILDMRGHKCPAPIIALGRQARQSPGQEVTLLADDPAAAYDVPAWCRMTGGVLITAQFDESAGSQRYEVRLPAGGSSGDSANKPGSASS